jgi:hypothetical protein
MTSRSGSGRDAVRPKGLAPYPKRPDDYGRNGSGRSPDKFATVSGELRVKGRGEGATRTYSQKEDDYSRMTVSTKASTRHDHYHDRPRSEATGGPLPGKSRKPVPYQDY